LRLIPAIHKTYLYGMDINLDNKKALVCGSTQGIGFAVAKELAAMGATVTLLARNENSLKNSIAELPATRNQSHNYLVADFSDPAQLQKNILQFNKANGPYHILINNTGGPAGAPVTEAIPEQFENAFRQHLVCNHILVTALLPGMKEAGFGRIVNIISTSVKQPLNGLGVSNTVRAAVANWSKTLAGEVASFGITVNNVLPGATLTGRLSSLIEAKSLKTGRSVEELKAEMIHEIPAGRFGEPAEIAAAAAFLCTPAASYITGINLTADGGRTGCL
jgi:3-oxoacyl-[acyl-carrier protein] reductase